MRARVDRLYHELMRENGERLKKIKNENKRNVEESQLLWDAAAAAEVELEGELEEEAADKRLAAYEAGNLEFTEA
jgi:hypothetical protein